MEPATIPARKSTLEAGYSVSPKHGTPLAVAVMFLVQSHPGRDPFQEVQGEDRRLRDPPHLFSNLDPLLRTQERHLPRRHPRTGPLPFPIYITSIFSTTWGREQPGLYRRSTGRSTSWAAGPTLYVSLFLWLINTRFRPGIRRFRRLDETCGQGQVCLPFGAAARREK